MARPRIYRINGQKYDITLKDEVVGFCQCPGDTRIMVILDDLRTKAGMDTAIHELLHAVEPEKSERWVSARAKEMTAVLWRLGFRRK